MIANLGRLDVLQTGGLDRLIASLARYSERCWLEAEGEGRLDWAKCYGPVLVFRRLWEHLGLDRLVSELTANSRMEFPVEEAAFALVVASPPRPGEHKGHLQLAKNSLSSPI